MILYLGLPGAVIYICYRFYRRLKRGGAGETVATLGATYDMQGKDQKRAIETIVELKAGKKLEEQESSDPPD